MSVVSVMEFMGESSGRSEGFSHSSPQCYTPRCWDGMAAATISWEWQWRGWYRREHVKNRVGWWHHEPEIHQVQGAEGIRRLSTSVGGGHQPPQNYEWRMFGDKSRRLHDDTSEPPVPHAAPAKNQTKIWWVPSFWTNYYLVMTNIAMENHHF